MIFTRCIFAPAQFGAGLGKANFKNCRKFAGLIFGECRFCDYGNGAFEKLPGIYRQHFAPAQKELKTEIDFLRNRPERTGRGYWKAHAAALCRMT